MNNILLIYDPNFFCIRKQFVFNIASQGRCSKTSFFLSYRKYNI